MASGLRITQVLRFAADSYAVEHEIRVENGHTGPQRGDLAMGWVAPAEWPKEEDKFGGARPLHVVRLDEGAFCPTTRWT